MKRILLFAAFSFITIIQLGAQSAYAPFDRDFYHLIDRYGILQNTIEKSTFKPYRRDDIATYVDALRKDSLSWGKVDRFNLDFLGNDNWEFSSLHTPYSKKTWK